jgi:hypothetical protein
LESYETAFKSLQKTLGADVPPLTKSNLQQFVVGDATARHEAGLVQHLHQSGECLLFVVA